MGYLLRGHEGERNNCFSKIQLAGQKYQDKTTLTRKARDGRERTKGYRSRFSRLYHSTRARTTLTKSDEKATARSLVEICFILSYLTLSFFFPET